MPATAGTKPLRGLRHAAAFFYRGGNSDVPFRVAVMFAAFLEAIGISWFSMSMSRTFKTPIRAVSWPMSIGKQVFMESNCVV